MSKKVKTIYEEVYKFPEAEVPAEAVITELSSKKPDKVFILSRGAVKIDGEAYVKEDICLLYRAKELDNE